MPVRALKALVIGMAVIIVVGFVVVVATIAQRVSGFAREEATAIGDIVLPMAEACGIAEITPLDDVLVAVRLEGPRAAGCESVLLVDLEAAQVVGRLQAGEGAADAPAN